MFSTSIHVFWTSRFICFGLLDSYVFDFDFYIFDFEFEIFDFEFEIFDFEFEIFDFEFEIFDFDCKNSRLRLKYYCSYFCPQRNAMVLTAAYKSRRAVWRISYSPSFCGKVVC